MAKQIQRAILSVSDKEGIVEFARGLGEFNITILSTGGTAKLLREQGVQAEDISSVTDNDIVNQIVDLFSLEDGNTTFRGDYLRADSSEPGKPGSADVTDPANPIYHIFIMSADDLTTAENLVLTVKAAGVAVRVEST